MKKIAIIILLLSASLLFFIGKTNSQLQPYYSGDAVNFSDKIIFATANSGKLEIFKLDGKVVSRIMEISNFDPVFNANTKFSDLKLSIENGSLYVYAVSEYTLYKYDISNLSSARLEKKVRNNYWEWYQRVDRLGDNLATFSEKGIKIYNADMEVIDSYNFVVENPYSIRSNGSNQYLFAITNSKLEVYDRLSRTLVKEMPLNFIYPENNHQAYYDILNDEIYAIDDYYTYKFDMKGNVLGSFKHLDRPGYEVESSYGSPYLYFSNGIGVVKMTKENFKVADYAFTSLAGGAQGWAMGLKVVNTGNGDVLVVFNGSNIILLDKNLNKIDSIKAKSDSVAAYANENLFLNLDRSWSLVNNSINLSGGGFWPNEPLVISLGVNSFSAQTGSNGRFTKEINTPDLKAGYHDIKVIGVNSDFSYSISVQIK